MNITVQLIITQIARRRRNADGTTSITRSVHRRHQPLGRRYFVRRANVGRLATNLAAGPTAAKWRQTNRSVQQRHMSRLANNGIYVLTNT